jgi:hypothetical protein
MAQTATPFTQFWDALNANLHVQCLPELTYGMARDLWTQATMEATKEARIVQRRGIRAAFAGKHVRRVDGVLAI